MVELAKLMLHQLRVVHQVVSKAVLLRQPLREIQVAELVMVMLVVLVTLVAVAVVLVLLALQLLVVMDLAEQLSLL